MHFHIEIGKTFLYYGFTVKKEYHDELIRIYQLSMENLQKRANLRFLGHDYEIIVRMVNQNRKKTTKLAPEDLPTRILIQISYQSNKELLSKFNDVFTRSKESFESGNKLRTKERIYFSIDDDGKIYCSLENDGLLNISQKADLIDSDDDDSTQQDSEFLESLWSNKSSNELIEIFYHEFNRLMLDRIQNSETETYFDQLDGQKEPPHFWELQEIIVDLGLILSKKLPEDLESSFSLWGLHENFWARYLSTGAIQYARNVIENPDYENEEFAMEWWFFHMKEDGE